jgi:hypothetical protein
LLLRRHSEHWLSRGPVVDANRPLSEYGLYDGGNRADGDLVVAGGTSIYERRLSRPAQLACGFVLGTLALYGATWLFNLLLVYPDATSPSDRRLIALVLYWTAAALTTGTAVAVVRWRGVAFPPGRRATLAAIAGSLVGGLAIAALWAFGVTYGPGASAYVVGALPAYVVLATPLMVAAAAGKGRGRAAAVVLSWTATMLCASAWLAHVMQQV